MCNQLDFIFAKVCLLSNKVSTHQICSQLFSILLIQLQQHQVKERDSLAASSLRTLQLYSSLKYQLLHQLCSRESREALLLMMIRESISLRSWEKGLKRPLDRPRFKISISLKLSWARKCLINCAYWLKRLWMKELLTRVSILLVLLVCLSLCFYLALNQILKQKI